MNFKTSWEEQSASVVVFYVCLSLYTLFWLAVVMLAIHIARDCVAYCLLPAQGEGAGRPRGTDVVSRPRRRDLAVRMKKLGQSQGAAVGRHVSLSTTSGYGSNA